MQERLVGHVHERTLDALGERVLQGRQVRRCPFRVSHRIGPILFLQKSLTCKSFALGSSRFLVIRLLGSRATQREREEQLAEA